MTCTAEIEGYGPRFIIRYTCGCSEFADTRGEARRNAGEHRRWEHPTDEERLRDSIWAVESELPGCKFCGHGDHTYESCPSVVPNKKWER